MSGTEQCVVCQEPIEGHPTTVGEGLAHDECASIEDGLESGVDILPDGGQSVDGTDRSAIHGDVFEELPTLDDDSAHAAVIDYPWQFQEEDGTGFFGNEGDGWSDFDQFNTEDTNGLAVILDECERVLVEGAWVFVFADDEILDDFRTIVEESPLERRRTLVWDRCTIGIGQYFRSRHMFLIAATVGSTDRYVRDRPTVLEATRQDGFLREHDYPTGKPPALYRMMLAPPVLEDGERLLEPFCGGAPGAAIATERGLGYWGCDVNPDSIDRAEAFFEQKRFGQTKLVPDGSGRNNCNEDTESDQEVIDE